jgi:hypothetical protein
MTVPVVVITCVVTVSIISTGLAHSSAIVTVSIILPTPAIAAMIIAGIVAPAIIGSPPAKLSAIVHDVMPSAIVKSAAPNAELRTHRPSEAATHYRMTHTSTMIMCLRHIWDYYCCYSGQCRRQSI